MLKILLALLLALPALGASPEIPDETTRTPHKELQDFYQILCTPGSEGYGQNEAKNMREFMMNLFAQPGPVVADLKKNTDSFGGALAFGIACGSIVMLEKIFAEKSCTTESGAKVDTTPAIQVCKQAIAELEKEQKENEEN